VASDADAGSPFLVHRAGGSADVALARVDALFFDAAATAARSERPA
jgi:hypothetical protein